MPTTPAQDKSRCSDKQRFCGNSDQCAINTGNFDQIITVTVTLTQNGASETLASRVIINHFCGNQLC